VVEGRLLCLDCYLLEVAIDEGRLACGWTQAQLAERLGCHQPEISELENGHHAPSLATVERVAAVLGVRPARLLG
jgi:transcriptional regulator with XRE-family HTH domain